MSATVWHPQGDWQVGRIDGDYVVLARGATHTGAHVDRSDLPLWTMATCRDIDHARRIVAALREVQP